VQYNLQYVGPWFQHYRADIERAFARLSGASTVFRGALEAAARPTAAGGAAGAAAAGEAAVAPLSASQLFGSGPLTEGKKSS
jgi:hypothetical protein